MTDNHAHPISPITPVSPYPPLRSPEYRSRAPEFYGFVAWTSTSLLFCLYLLWALLPDEAITRMGVEWYPNREWAILVPAWSVIVIILTYVVYSSLAIAATPSFSDMSTIVDPQAHFPSIDCGGSYLDSAEPAAIPELYDIPLGLVNRVIYLSYPKNRAFRAG